MIVRQKGFQPISDIRCQSQFAKLMLRQQDIKDYLRESWEYCENCIFVSLTFVCTICIRCFSVLTLPPEFDKPACHAHICMTVPHCSYIYGSEAADKRLILSTVSVGSFRTVMAAQSVQSIAVLLSGV